MVTAARRHGIWIDGESFCINEEGKTDSINQFISDVALITS